MNNEELKHYGIKGQKWGVRRFQKKDGSLTPAGKERYDDGPSKPKHKEKLVTKYMSEGLNEKDARSLAERRVKAEKVIAGVALVSATAFTAHAINQHVKYRADKIIKEGTELQRIIPAGKHNMDKALYTAYNKNDKLKYEGIFGFDKSANGYFDVEKMTLQSKQPIRTASRKKVEDTFLDLYKNDTEFKSNMVSSIKEYQKCGWIPHQIDANVKELINEIETGSKGVSITDKRIRSTLYDAFNSSINNHTESGKKASRAFYAKLLDAGYDAIADINDQKYSGYDAKSPTIVFNTAKLAIAKVETLSKQEINDARDKAYAIKKGQRITSEILNKVGQYKIVAGVAAGAIAGIPATQVAAIKKYRIEHPNSELTDKEILALL